MPAASIPSRPIVSTLRCSTSAASSRARSASRVGVISLAGAFWRSRAALTAAGHDLRPAHGLAHVLVRGQRELLDPAVVVVLGLVGAVRVRGQQRALDEAARDVVIDVVRQLPAQLARAELARAAHDRRGRDPRALGVEAVALAEPGEDVAPAARVGDGELAQARPRLARVDQRLQHALVDVVGDRLAVEQPDRDRVGPAVGGGFGGCFGAHRRIVDSPPCPEP